MEGSGVAKIVMHYFNSCSTFSGFELFNKQEKCVLSAISYKETQKEIILADGERILGVKSKLCYPFGNKFHKSDGACHSDLQFIIGRLE